MMERIFMAAKLNFFQSVRPLKFAPLLKPPSYLSLLIRSGMPTLKAIKKWKLNSLLGKRRIRLQKENQVQPFGKPTLSGSASLHLNPKLCLHNAVHYRVKQEISVIRSYIERSRNGEYLNNISPEGFRGGRYYVKEISNGIYRWPLKNSQLSYLNYIDR